MAKQTFSQN